MADDDNDPAIPGPRHDPVRDPFIFQQQEIENLVERTIYRILETIGIRAASEKGRQITSSDVAFLHKMAQLDTQIALDMQYLDFLRKRHATSVERLARNVAIIAGIVGTIGGIITIYVAFGGAGLHR